MRILQVNNYADPVGGAEVYARGLCRELERRGHAVGFFGTAPDREVDEASLRVVRRPRYDRAVLFRDPAVATALDAFLTLFRPEIVHVHNVYSLGLDVLEALARKAVPVVQTVHDFNLLCPNSWCVRGDGSSCPGGAGAQCFQHRCQENYPYDAEVALVTRLKHEMLAARVDLAICPSRHLADQMRVNGYRDVRHQNYFIDPIPTDPTLPRADKELVFIGRLEREKGVGYLLDAMPAVLAVQPAVRLTIVGGGALEKELRAHAERLALGPRVLFQSQVPRDELGRFYATATACVLPSIWTENSPLVAYECLAAGLPMIASRIGGIPELVSEGTAGFTFAPRDSADLAAQVLRLLALSHEERARMSALMRERSAEHRPGPHLAWLAERYREVLDRGPAPAPSHVRVDSDLLTLLERFSEERAHLGRVFHEHVGHIQYLERALAARDRTVTELARSAAENWERVLALEGEGPRRLLRRFLRRVLTKLRSSNSRPNVRNSAPN